MQNKLQELTEKIYQDGVSKGNEEADRIISGAKTEAEKIISEAEKEAVEIVVAARKEADDLMGKTLSGLKISFKQATNILKQEIESSIAFKVVDEPVSEAFADSKFLSGLIEIATEKWAAKKTDDGIEVYIPEDMIKDVEQYLNKKTNNALAGGITLIPVKTMTKGFEIRPSGKEYKISVTESDFSGYLKEIMKPKLTGLLFEKDK